MSQPDQIGYYDELYLGLGLGFDSGVRFRDQNLGLRIWDQDWIQDQGLRLCVVIALEIWTGDSNSGSISGLRV